MLFQEVFRDIYSYFLMIYNALVIEEEILHIEPDDNWDLNIHQWNQEEDDEEDVNDQWDQEEDDEEDIVVDNEEKFDFGPYIENCIGPINYNKNPHVYLEYDDVLEYIKNNGIMSEEFRKVLAEWDLFIPLMDDYLKYIMEEVQ